MKEQFTYGEYNALMQLDLKSMIAFIVVVETGNLYTASIVLGCSQPAVSVYLKRVKNYFPEELFTREGRSLSPTIYAYRLSDELRSSFANVYCVLSKTIDNNLISSTIK